MGKQQKITINVGTLKSFYALNKFIAHKLKEYSDSYSEGERPEVEWDLTKFQSKQINLSALTAFLAILYRLRKFTRKPSSAIIHWNPEILTFLHDIGLFSISNNYDLIE